MEDVSTSLIPLSNNKKLAKTPSTKRIQAKNERDGMTELKKAGTMAVMEVR